VLQRQFPANFLTDEVKTICRIGDFQLFLSEAMIMVRALWLATTVLLLPFNHVLAESPGDRSGNAALKYWQAIAALPKLADAEVQKLNESYLTMPLDAHAKEIVEKAEYALKLMQRGAALKECDWGVSYEDGINVLLPHMGGARYLTSLACLRARVRLEAGQKGEAVDDLVAALALDRHISQGGLVIETVFGYSLENRVGETLAICLPKLDATTIKDLKTRLNALPAAGNPAKAMHNEELSCIDWFIREAQKTKDQEALHALVQPFFVSEGKVRDFPEKARAFVEECGGDKEGVIKLAEETRSSYRLLAKKLDLPPEGFQEEYEREAKRQAKNPVFKTLFPALTNVSRAKARADIRRVLLAAALDVQLNGKDELKNHPDPVGGGPFDYVAFEGGFELSSKFKIPNEKPLVLTVGSRSK
jgi:hypothetical protein